MTPKERFRNILATRDICWSETVTIPNRTHVVAPTNDDDEIEKWLYKHIGKHGEDWVVHRYVNSDVYKFQNPDHKTLFSLTWL